MARKPTAQQKKVRQVMHEFKAGTLNSGKPGPGVGPVVSNRAQAIAIALSEASKVGKSGKSGTGSKPAAKGSASRSGKRK